ncbi:unnamed protein product [Ostreobium quekettii]|uniref:Uncharacterized protein n=1 Tax=Ostreobium quekettii TaxID=121088 RepID=A0A8S1ITA9_9CHLO|nr:unnamed protein product [Ostreobium quekettii]|eukprot:evm.model.scf_1991.2 EVM.evm.TU.scf_1991.2   scf_1991:10250-15662(+)
MTSEPQQGSPFEVQASLVPEAAPASLPGAALGGPEAGEPIAMELSGQSVPGGGELDAVGEGSAGMASASGVEPMDLEPANGATLQACPPAPAPIVVPGKSSSDTVDGAGQAVLIKEDSPRSDGSPSHPQKSPAGSQRPRKPHLQGRFSGRLETKDDEKALQEECRALGPLVGGAGKKGEKSRMTLAKIVRAIATGDVRRHCTMREEKITELQEKLKTVEAVYRRDVELLKQENNALRLKLELQGADDFNHRQVIITPASVPPMVVVRNNPGQRYSASDPMTSIGGGATPVDVPIPFLFPSGQGAQLQGLQANSPMPRAGRVAQLGSMDPAAAQARALAARSQAANNLNLKRKLQEMQQRVSQDLSPTAFNSAASGGGLPQQQVAFVSVPNYTGGAGAGAGTGAGEGEGNPGVQPALNLLGAQSGLQHSGGHDMHTPTVALTLGDDLAAQHFSQQAGFSGQKAVIVSNLQAANAALQSTGPFASHLLSGQIGLDNVLGHIPLSEALSTSAPLVIGGNDMGPTLEDSALSTPMETEMDPNILEQLNAGDLDLTTVAATIPVLQGTGGGAHIAMMPAAQVLRMSSDAGRQVG